MLRMYTRVRERDGSSVRREGREEAVAVTLWCPAGGVSLAAVQRILTSAV